MEECLCWSGTDVLLVTACGPLWGGGASMAAFLVVARATGLAARPGSRSTARPLLAASPATAPW
eukprot:scaffold168119_cov33-Tisochrysis_lutea.AAC.1